MGWNEEFKGVNQDLDKVLFSSRDEILMEMLSVIVQHSNGSVPKTCSGRQKDQRSAFIGAEKI